jgi:hypothetical protein
VWESDIGEGRARRPKVDGCNSGLLLDHAMTLVKKRTRLRQHEWEKKRFYVPALIFIDVRRSSVRLTRRKSLQETKVCFCSCAAVAAARTFTRHERGEAFVTTPI